LRFNSLQVIGIQEGIRFIYTKTRFDAEKPPYRVELYEVPARVLPLPVLDDVVKCVFGRAFLEENPVPIGDVTKLTFSVSADKLSREKTFYQRVPDDLRKVKSQLDTLMKTCEQTGKKTVRYQ
jgi:hypothetical protein